MSFMAGFGEAFSTSFRETYDREEKKHQDAIDKQWELYKENDKERREQEKANRQDWKYAQTIADGVTVPTEAAHEIYKRKQAGWSDSALREWASSVDWSVTRAGPDVEVKAVDPRDETSSTSESSESSSPTANKRNTDFKGNIDQRMAGVQTPQAPQGPASAPSQPTKANTTQTTPTTQPPVQLASASQRTEAANPFNDRRTMKAQRDAAKRVGVPLEEFRRVISSGANGAWEPPSIPEGVLVTYSKKPGERKPDPINELNEAYIEAEFAKESGDPVRIRESQIRIKGIMAGIAAKAEIEAAKRGDAPSTYNIFDDKGQYVTTVPTKINENGERVLLDNSPLPPNAMPVTPAEAEFKTKISQSLQEDAVKLAQAKSGLIGAMRATDNMRGLIESSPDQRVLNKPLENLLGAGERWIHTTNQAVKDITSVFKDVKTTNDLKNAMGQIDINRLEKLSDDLKARGNNTPGAQRALLEANAAIWAYHYAASLNQEGRNLQEKEREMFQEIGTGGINLAQFDKKMSDLMNLAVDTLDDRGRMIYENNTLLRQFQADHNGMTPANFIYQPLATDLKNTTDEQLKRVYKVMEDNRGYPSQVTKDPNEENKPRKVTQEEIDKALRAPEGASIEDIRKWFKTIPNNTLYIDPGDGKPYWKKQKAAPKGGRL